MSVAYAPQNPKNASYLYVYARTIYGTNASLTHEQQRIRLVNFGRLMTSTTPNGEKIVIQSKPITIALCPKF